MNKVIKFEKRPRCLNIGCNNVCHHTGTRYRPFCVTCHVANYKNLPLPYGVKPFKTGKCSNHDGHLGFTCGWDYEKAPWAIGLTQVDHIDGNYLNNIPSNADELCETCHKQKGKQNGDYKIQNKYSFKK
jgi:5-methylcytosine-specific restriction endonuclease McrA